MDLYDEIYYSLLGQMEWPVAGVPNAFAPGSPCQVAYSLAIDARDRVQARLGGEDDVDLHQMLVGMETIQRLLCRAVMELYLH